MNGFITLLIILAFIFVLVTLLFLCCRRHRRHGAVNPLGDMDTALPPMVLVPTETQGVPVMVLNPNHTGGGPYEIPSPPHYSAPPPFQPVPYNGGASGLSTLDPTFPPPPPGPPPATGGGFYVYHMTQPVSATAPGFPEASRPAAAPGNADLSTAAPELDPEQVNVQFLPPGNEEEAHAVYGSAAYYLPSNPKEKDW